MTIADELYLHLTSDNGVPNDSRTDELYRKAKGVPEDTETDLEDVERWAFDTLNRKLAREYWSAVNSTK